MYAQDVAQRPRLQPRRGSMSAGDPWAIPSPTVDGERRGETSRLTIVRVPSNPASPDEGNTPLHSRSNSSSSIARRSSWGNHSGGNLGGGSGPARLSFAVSSFTPISPGGASSSTPTSPTVAFGRRTYSNPNLTPFRPNLAPQQLYDLAMSSIAASSSSRPQSPAPAPFTALPKSHYLPFVVRPVEVQQLISNPPTSRLFALLGQLFPPPRDPPSNNPTEWNFSQLEHWLTKVDRHEASDRVWARKARACIRTRSEPLWERFKGAIGVPPELEDDSDSENDEAIEFEPPEPTTTATTVAGGGGPVPAVTSTPNIGEQTVPGPIPPVAVQNPDGQETDADEDEDEEEAHTQAWVEPIYPGSSPVISPAMSRLTSPATEESFGFGGRAGAMENIGEEEEDAATRASGASGVPELTPDNSVTTQDDQNIQGLRFVSSTITSPYTGDSAVDQAPLDRESGNPLFPSNFASLSLGPTMASSNPYAPPMHPPTYVPIRRGSRGQQSRMSREYAETFMTGSSG